MYRAARQDDNHDEIRTAARNYGCGWLDTFQLKKCCDAVLTYKGRTIAIEIKDGSKVPSARKLTKGEIEFRDYWISKGGNYALIESIDDLIALLSNDC